MSESHVVRDLRERFPTFSPQLRKAARFIVDNPNEVAMHSMRAMAAQAGVQPSVMLRLAKAIGFESYEPLREHFRQWMLKASQDWDERAKQLRSRARAEDKFLNTLISQEMTNLSQTFGDENVRELGRAVDLMMAARRVYVLGLRSMFSASFYFHYLTRLFSEKTILISGIGGATADVLRDISERDVLIVFSQQPYARDAVTAIAFAGESGAGLVAVTDSRVSPVAVPGGVTVVISNATDAVLPSALPVMAVAHVLATMFLIANGEADAALVIKRSMKQLERFNVYVP